MARSCGACRTTSGRSTCSRSCGPTRPDWRARPAGRSAGRDAGLPADIPVVVHVVYHTDPTNITDEQIASQIDVLNEDYAGPTPTSRGAGAVRRPRRQCRAVVRAGHQQDPDGNPTSGITRTKTTEGRLRRRRLREDGAHGGHGRLGREAVPQHLGVPARRRPARLRPVPRRSAGDRRRRHPAHRASGPTGTAAAPFDLGRTATHEIGHWLNLRHIWGDDGTGCSGDDYVADTPEPGRPELRQARPSRTCQLRQRPERRHVHELHGLRRRRGDVHVHRRAGRADAGRARSCPAPSSRDRGTKPTRPPPRRGTRQRSGAAPHGTPLTVARPDRPDLAARARRRRTGPVRVYHPEGHPFPPAPAGGRA